MMHRTEPLNEIHAVRSCVASAAPLRVRSDLADLDSVALIDGSPTLTVESFVEQYGDCVVQSRGRNVGYTDDDALDSVANVVARARAEAPTWTPDAHLRSYLFHDNLMRKGSYRELQPLFHGHQPPDEVIDLSEQLPCGGMLVVLGASDTSSAMHSHGPAYCMLLDGVKEWWIWPRDVDHVLRWVTSGAVAENRLAYWEVHVQPALERGADILDILDALERRGLFKPPPSAHRSTEVIQRMRSGDEAVPAAARFRPLRVTQRAGQGIYIPERFGHAVRNRQWHLALIYQLEPAGEHY